MGGIRSLRSKLRVVFAAMVISAATLAPTAADELAKLTAYTEDIRPAFRLQDLTGTNIPLAGFQGRTVVVHFFATWCEPCRYELSALSRLSARAASRRIAVLAISVAEFDLSVRTFVAKHPVSFPVLLDRDRATTRAWNVRTLPTTFVLDPNLVPRLVATTDVAWDLVGVEEILQTIATAGRADEDPAASQPAAVGIEQGG